MPDYGFTDYNADLKSRARELRRKMTKQERRLWYDFLRVYPVKFYRQRAIGRFIVDFYCSAAKLAVELDGSQHYYPEGQSYDEERTQELQKHGLKVLRFSNLDVNMRFEGVCQAIDAEVRERTRKNDTDAE